MAEDNQDEFINPYAGSNDPAIKAYFDARRAKNKISTNWDTVSDIAGSALAGLEQHRYNVQIDEENKRRELEAYETQFTNNTLKITENAGSLGEEYYGLATEEAKKLQEEYMQAVQGDDKAAQGQIKMKLNGLSTSVQSLKEALSIAAELKNDDALSNGRTAKEKQISAACTDPNNVMYKDGEWVFKNPDYKESEGDLADGSNQEFFTLDDLSKSLGEKDETTKLAYLDYENSMNASGSGYVDGSSAASFNAQRIKTAIGDQFINQDNIMSIMHDDFRGAGESNTFVRHISGYLDELSKGDNNFYKNLGIDVDGPDGVPDGVIDHYDYDMVGEDKSRIIDAITNKDSDYGYDFEMTKDIVADWLTMNAENKFYGEIEVDGRILTIKERKAMRPDPGENPETFMARGGIMGVLSSLNMRWDAENETWENTSYDKEDIANQYKNRE